MNASDWRTVKALFDHAVDLPAAERQAYVDGACDRADLCAQVRDLLARHDVPSGVLADVVRDEAGVLLDETGDSDPLVGQRLGAYRVLGEISRGGMGTVFLAARDDNQYARRVAIKVVRRGLDTGDVLRRFAAERQILARFDHPRICRLIDAGTTPDGRPYIVQDHVEGERLLQYCDARQLETGARLELFAMVCDAVHYAHQRLVVHRDLKPGNVLVTSSGEPILLDFGIAKVLDPDPADAPTVTSTQMRALTPDYASPEQVRGEPVTTATDVYSLGVVLYELLTGQSPYRVTTRSRAALERAVCDDEPLPPSAAVGHNVRLRRRLAGDLDAIALKAIAKDPNRRYASAEALSEDVRRTLSGVPITAGRVTFLRRTRAFVRRHRWGVGAAAAIVVALGVGLAVAARQAQVASMERARAEQRSDELRTIAGSLISDIGRLGGSMEMRQVLTQRGLDYLQVLAKDASGDPALAIELAQAYLEMGGVLGEYFGNNSTGNFAGALDLYDRGIEQLTARDVWPTALQQERLRLLSELSRLSAETRSILGDTERALADVTASRGWLEASVREDATTPASRPALNPAMARRLLLTEADLLLMTGDTRETFRVLEVMRAHIAEHFTPPASYLPWGTYYARLGAARHVLAVSVAGRLADTVAARHLMRMALDDQRRGLDFRSRQVEADHVTFPALPAQCLLFMGNLAFDLDREADGQRWIDEAIRMIVTRDGLDAGAWGYHWRGRLRLRQGRPRDALRAWEPLAPYFARIAAQDPGVPANHWAAFLEDQGDAYWALEQHRTAEQAFRQALSIREALVAKGPTNGEFASNLVYGVTRFATHLTDAGRADEARRETTRVLTLLRRQADAPDAVATRLTEYAWLLLVAQPADLRDVPTALDYARRAIDLPRGNHTDAWAVLAVAQYLAGETEAAVASALRAYTLVPELRAGRDDATLARDIRSNLARHPLTPLARPLWF